MRAVLLMCVALGLGACASKPAEVAKVADGQEAKADPRCLRETGTKIKNRAGCVNGRVITAEELEATGAGTVGDVLTKLPAR
jgi:hypothetical protein